MTEEVTGIDIVRAQILVSEGKTIAEATGARSQKEVLLNGHALQCRITTEDPQNNFVPDYGRITAYRSATGMGIRLDGGTAYSGAVITRYYDSLLVKVTAWAPTPDMAIARMDRTLREFRIRGVNTNIAFVENLLKHPTFLDNTYTTKFIDTTPELFKFKKRQDRATKILTYVADISVNGHTETKGQTRPVHFAAIAQSTQIQNRDAAKGCAKHSGDAGTQGCSRLDAGTEKVADHRHDHARWPSVASCNANAFNRHGQCGECLFTQSE